MLVEINLLPKKNIGKKTLYIIIAGFLLLIAVLLLLLNWQINTREDKLASTEKELSKTMDLVETNRQLVSDYQSDSSVQVLENAIAWAEAQPFDTVYLLEQLIRMLPDRGYVTDFSISNDNQIKQTIQFDTKSEAAYYLHSLLSYDWVKEAVLSDAKASDLYSDANTSQSEENINDDVLPRYVASYQITIDTDKLKNAAADETELVSEDEKGSDTP